MAGATDPDPGGVAQDRSSTLAALGAGLLSAAIGAWTAYLLLIIEGGSGIKALGWGGVDGVLWLSLTMGALGRVW